ncbi:MAG: 5'/3'-nucleotidase SurE [Dehalococcoidales bacterium]|jgi:5'-nucleotidase
MKILVTNDDGIFADGLWILVEALSKIAQVVVVAPDREQSVIGTAVSLRRPLRVHSVEPIVPEVETYSVEGTPADSVILALGKLAKDSVDLVVSGINQGPNLGDDVFISGTVSAALRGYLHGLPSLAISVCTVDNHSLSAAAKLAALLAKRIYSNALPANAFLNVNLPALPLTEIKGIKVTQPASQSHSFTVEEEHDGNEAQYRLIYRRVNKDTNRKTDIRAIEQGNISITPLHIHLLNKPSPTITDSLFSDLLRELQQY